MGPGKRGSSVLCSMCGDMMKALAVVSTLCTSGPFRLQVETRTGF